MAKTETPKKTFNWSALKTNVIVAFIFIAIGIVSGYFMSISVINNTQASVIQNVQAAVSVVTVKK